MVHCRKGTMRKGKMARWTNPSSWFHVLCFILRTKCFHSSVWFAVITLVYMELSTRGGTTPVCSYRQAGCRLPPLDDIFDRVIRQSSRMHGISSDLHSEFVSCFFFLPWPRSSIIIHQTSTSTHSLSVTLWVSCLQALISLCLSTLTGAKFHSQ